MSKVTKKVVKAWAGICEGKIDTGWLEREGFSDTTHGIYKTKKEASEHYELVVPCTISYSLPLQPKKKIK